ncbi:hypothetical protein ZWY2020_020295 [Hordeum vulgare]|nr:hypothetical protein ZWY2020_020293 [Hordeum vulgare]KAI4987495.1 hypothetical protein ZWY2020_020295 [Hordeum vulgare]
MLDGGNGRIKGNTRDSGFKVLHAAAAFPRSSPAQQCMRPSHMWQIDVRPMAEVADVPRLAVPGVSTPAPHIPPSADGNDDCERCCSSPNCFGRRPLPLFHHRSKTSSTGQKEVGSTGGAISEIARERMEHALRSW